MTNNKLNIPTYKPKKVLKKSNSVQKRRKKWRPDCENTGFLFALFQYVVSNIVNGWQRCITCTVSLYHSFHNKSVPPTLYLIRNKDVCWLRHHSIQLSFVRRCGERPRLNIAQYVGTAKLQFFFAKLKYYLFFCNISMVFAFAIIFCADVLLYMHICLRVSFMNIDMHIVYAN